MKYKIDRVNIRINQKDLDRKYNEDSLMAGLSIDPNGFTDKDLELGSYKSDGLVVYHDLPNSNEIYVFCRNTSMEIAIYNTIGISNLPAIDNLFDTIMERLSHQDLFYILQKHKHALDKYLVAKIEVKGV